MPIHASGRSTLIAMAAWGAAVVAATAAEIRVEAEGFRFRVTSIGEEPSLSAGADVSNDLRLEGLGPSLSLGVSLGPSRRVELRWRGVEDENAYATAHPDLIVLEGEQRVSRDAIDALLVQRLGKSPGRLEVGYRHVGLERSWRDAVGDRNPYLPAELATLDYSSKLSAHGVRGAVGIGVPFVKRLYLEGTLGLSVLRAQESLRSVTTDAGPYARPSRDRSFEGGRTVNMLDASIRLRVDVTSRVFVAIGYRYDSWEKGEDRPGEFDALGPTYAVGLRLGGPR